MSIKIKVDYENGNKYSGFEFSCDGTCCVSRVSPVSMKLNKQVMDITFEQYKNWIQGMLIQNAMPHLTEDQREFILSGLLPEEFDMIFL